MKHIADAINQLKNDGFFTLRESKSFSFGTLNECKKKLREAILSVDRTITDFVWLKQYTEVAEWLSDTKGKGLLLRGSCGTGKTTLLLAIIVLFKAYKGMVLYFTPASVLPEKEGITRQWAYCIDDVGTEYMRNNYGEKSEVFQLVADDADLKIKLLLMTTNLNAKDMARRYGQRTVDRICRLCKIVKFEITAEITDNAGKTVKSIKDISSMRK